MRCGTDCASVASKVWHWRRKGETTFAHLQAESFQHQHTQNISWLMSVGSHANGRLSPSNGYKERSQRVRSDAARCFEETRGRLGEVNVNWRSCTAYTGVGGKSIVSKSQRTSDQHSEMPTPRVTNELCCHGGGRNCSIFRRSHVHIIFRKIVLLQE